MANATVLGALSDLQDSPLTSYVDAPHCVVAVDRTRACFFRYESGNLTQIEMQGFKIDKSQWKMKDHAHMARRDTKMPHGAERDVFKKRMDAQYQHFCRETAGEIRAVCRIHKLAGIILVGSARLIEPIAEALPKAMKPQLTMIPKDLARFSLVELKRHVVPAIKQWERAQEASVVDDLLGSESGTVVGIDETLAQLQDGRIRKLLVAKDLNVLLKRCVKCGMTNRSADPLCAACGSQRRQVQFRDVFPELAKIQKAGIEEVTGDAAQKLIAAGGVGGWLRPRRQPKVL